jgi:hypothetical protein
LNENGRMMNLWQKKKHQHQYSPYAQPLAKKKTLQT